MLSTLVCLALAGVCTSSAAAEKTPPPAAAKFYPLIGKWSGRGELGSPGQPPAKLALRLQCRKASAGAGVLCEMSASNKEMNVRETDLFGVDPVTGRGHWYAVSNQGETHDHIADWPDARTMKARMAWTQDGKRMEENITAEFPSPRELLFRSVVTQEGKELGSFSGRLKR